MALKPCQGCGREVDETAVACPGCGRPKPTKVAMSMGSRVLWGGVLFVGLFLWVKSCGNVASGLQGNSAGTGQKSLALKMFEQAATPAGAGSPSVITVPLANVTADYDRRTICTCGFVQSVASSPDHSTDGTHLRIIHSVYVTEKARLPRANESPETVICWWAEGAPPNVRKWQRACVQGEVAGALIKDCSVVPACP